MTPIVQFVLALAVILLAAKLGGYISVRLGQPSVLGKLLAGVVLGPSVLNFLHWPIFTDPTLEENIAHLAELGVIVLMFIAGLEVDVAEMRKSGRASTLGGVLGVIVPFVLGLLATRWFGYEWSTAVFVGLILTATSVSISAQTLMELDALRTRVGLTLLGAAVVDDVLVILLLSIALAVGSGGGGPMDVALVVVKMVLYLVGAILLGVWALPRLARYIERLPISEPVVSVALIVMLLYAWAAEAVGGVAMITGAFIAGVLFGRTYLRHSLERGMHALAYAFMVPIFFVSIGLEANLRLLTASLLWFTTVIVLVAIIAKILGSGLGVKLVGFSNVEALQVGIGMVSRGEVGLIVASIGIAAGAISEELFTVTVVMVLVTTLVTPPALRWALQRGQVTPTPTAPTGGG